MSSSFFEKSKEIANNYIQNIVFLDDRAYKIKDEAKLSNDFDVARITSLFAKEKKICAVYQPGSERDIEDFKVISSKSDVVVLDWEINFPKIVKPGTENEDDDDEPRGIYTKSIIKSILFEEGQTNKSLKMILVYTGDYAIIKDIVNEIHKEVFDSSELYILDEENLSITSQEFKVLVRSKKVDINNKSNKGLEKHMIDYEYLPKFIIEEFTKMTSGLLPNFALLSLTTLRKNSSKIIGLFSKKLDSAYLSHKALLPNQDDAEELLIELYADTVSDLLFYDKVNNTTKNLIEDWISKNILEEVQEIFDKKGKSYEPAEKFKRSADLLLEILKSSEKNIIKRYKEAFNSKANVSKAKIEDYYEKLSLNNTLLFLNNDDHVKKTEIDHKFSILTHHKSLFIPNNTIPKLTLGTVVRSTLNTNSYYICIQQRCDSVRIAKGSERKFLFIPLSVSVERFDVLTPDNIKLKRNKDSFSIRTIKFICSNDFGVVSAEKDKNTGDYIFQQKYNSSTDEHFTWIFDLKDLHSQRIITQYSSQLSRVGLNDSEWHRMQLS
ncbi:response regulator receiver domain [Chryseobacterium paludis]|uniref:response regulator receiver domain n=1 Tax=Chryseobacterium paludis TaxID=2956784 RepID=UPI0021C2467B|nr:response regulator receiver domain [Chryseobacterium paludis]